MAKWGMVIDLEKCTGCQACTTACQMENNRLPNENWQDVLFYVEGEYPSGKLTWLPRPCMHCEDPSCMAVCPTGATYKTEDGVVLIDWDKCIGCKYCMIACPYGVRFYASERQRTQPDIRDEYPGEGEMEWTPLWRMPDQRRDHRHGVRIQPHNVVSKCTFCYHRISQAPEGTADLDPNDPELRDFTPACVVTCAPTARFFGDLANPESKVSQLIADKGGCRCSTTPATGRRSTTLRARRRASPRPARSARTTTARRSSHEHAARHPFPVSGSRSQAKPAAAGGRRDRGGDGRVRRPLRACHAVHGGARGLQHFERHGLGLPIAIYLTLLLTSSGLTVLASLDLVFGLEAFHPIAKRCVWLALITLVAGFTVLALEIGHPFRMLWALPFAFQWRSPMWWMGVFYSFDLVLLVLKFWLMHTHRWHGWFPHLVTVVSFVTVICAAGTLGLVFGMMAMRPAWFNPTMPLYFMLTGFLSALAMIIFVVSLTGTRSAAELRLFEGHLPRLFMVALLGVLAMVAGRTITGLWSNYEGLETFGLRFEAFLAMFQNEVIIGLLVPLALMSTNRLRASRLARLVASSLVLIGMFFARFDLLIIGQQVPLFKGTYFFGVDAGTGFIEYWPSTTEWMLVPLGLGMVLFLYAAGQWLLRLSETPQAAAELVTQPMQVAQPAE